MTARLPDAAVYDRPWLYPAQQAALFDCRDVNGQPSRIACVEGSTKAGKAQPLDALVYTPAGPVRMGDVRVGDSVLIPGGGTAAVVGVYPQGVREVAALKFVDGTVVRADYDHLWEVHEYRKAPRLYTTRDLAKWPLWRLVKAWVPSVAPVEFVEQPVPVDPYLLGVLIGNGALRHSLSVSTPEAHTVKAIAAALPDGHALVKVPGENVDYRITCGAVAKQMQVDGLHLATILTGLGLRCGSHEKHIPDVYRYNSAAVRRAILQGILDTDGFVDTHGQPHLEQTSEQLAKDVTEIVQSLGGTVLTRYKAKAGYKRDGEFIRCRPVWRQLIRFEDVSWCFTLPRKAALTRPKKRGASRFFRSIDPTGAEPVQCIAIDHPRHLYLTDGMVPTHNTLPCLIWIFEQALQAPAHAHCWWIAPVYMQAKIAFRRLKRYIPKDLFTSNEAEMTITLANKVTIWFKSGERADNLYGEDVHAAVIDEASRTREDVWFAVRSTLTATRGKVRIIGNVKGAKNWFFKLARKAEAGMQGMSYARLTAYDAIKGGVLSAAEIEDAKRTLPEDVFNELYLAIPTEDGANPFGLQHIAACVQHGIVDERPVAIGGDLAKSVDWTVLLALAKSGQTCGFERWRSSWEDTERKILDLVPTHCPALLDSTGVGDPIVERLTRKRSNFRGFKFSMQSKQMLMENLAVGVQRGEVGILDGPVRAEMEIFEYEHHRLGVRYTAPSGEHDDCVMALALAYKQFCEARPRLVHVGGFDIQRISPWDGAAGAH